MTPSRVLWHKSSRCCKPVALLLLAISGLTPASGIEGVYTSGVGARSMALGGADVAFPEGPLSALGVNPAGLSLLKGCTLDWGATASVPTGHFRSRVGEGELENHFGIAPDLALGCPIRSSPVSIGIGVIPEAGVAAYWRYLDPPGGKDGKTSYGFQDNHAKVTIIRAAGGVSVELSRWFSIGGSVGLDYNTNVLKTPYVFQSQPALKGQKTFLDLGTKGFGLNGSVGMLFRPTDQFQIGLSYQSPTEIDSQGSVSGNGKAQLQSLGGPFARARPDFYYDAELDRKFPQRIFGGVSWKFHPRWRLALQTDWANWSDAFDVLPVKLTNGNNADINRFVGSKGFTEYTPLRWRDQVVYRAGVEYALTEAFFLRGGYAYGRSPVPDETLTPLSAVIPEHTLTAGWGYRWRCFQLDLAYQWDLPITRRVDRSTLLGSEYNNSSIHVGGHWFGLTTSIHY